MQTRGNTRARFGSRWKLWIGTCKAAVHWIRLSRRLGIAREWPTDALDPHPHPKLSGGLHLDGSFRSPRKRDWRIFFLPRDLSDDRYCAKSNGDGRVQS
jgi:hypothetical protein